MTKKTAVPREHLLMPLAIDPKDRNEKTKAQLRRIVDPERGLTLSEEYDLVEQCQCRLQKEAAQKERAVFRDAFTPGDDLDDERAIRAAGLLLDWGFGVNSGFGNDDDKEIMARGLAGALFLAADSIARTQRRFTTLQEKTGNAD
jgi:hypothetical protein